MTLQSARGDDQPPPHILEDVVVTATRQEARLLDQAGNTSLIDLKRIEFTAPQRPSEILNQLPGINIQQGSGEEHITAIRSPVLNGGAGQGSVLYLEDGIPLRAAGFGNVNGLYEANVEQAGSVEVIRGPGSALYGSNAVHGLINIIPRSPSKELERGLDLAGGLFGQGRAAATLSDTLGSIGYRLGAETGHEDGWRDRTRLDQQKMVVRGVWSGGNDTVTATLSGQYLDQQTGAYITGKNAYRDPGIAASNPVSGAYRRAESIRGGARWQHDLSTNLQLSITPYFRHTEMDFMMHFVPSLAIQRNAHSSLGVQTALYQSLEGGHSLILGTDAEYTEGWYKETQDLATFVRGLNVYPQGIHYDLDAGSTVLAPYIHTEWQVLDHTRLTAGLRVEETLYRYTNNADTGTAGLYQRPANRTDAFTTVTPKLGLTQTLAERLAAYLNLTRGARAPQVTDLYELQNRQVVGRIKAEAVDSAEMGLRGTIRTVTFDASAFWMSKHHYFYRAADGTNVTDGKTLHRGLEVGLSAPLPADFDLGAAASYALHTYAFDRTDSTAINTVRRGTIMPTAPRSLANIRVGYTFFPGTRAELEWVHMGGYITDNAGIHSYGGHELFNARLSARMDDGIDLYAKLLNLADRAYADRAAVTTTGVDQYLPGPPRTLSAGLRLRF